LSLGVVENVLGCMLYEGRVGEVKEGTQKDKTKSRKQQAQPVGGCLPSVALDKTSIAPSLRANFRQYYYHMMQFRTETAEELSISLSPLITIISININNNILSSTEQRKLSCHPRVATQTFLPRDNHGPFRPV
jgi:hypothetical protein